MSLGRLGSRLRGSMKRDPLESRPLLKNNFATYFSFSDEEKAFLSDVLSRETFIEIDRSSHDALEFADGKRTIREIAKLIYEKYPKRYDCIASAEKEMLSLFQKLSTTGPIELIGYS